MPQNAIKCLEYLVGWAGAEEMLHLLIQHGADVMC